MPTQSNRNYTAIEVVKGDMANLHKKVDQGFSDVKEQIGELRDDIKEEIRENYVTKSEFSSTYQKADFAWKTIMGIGGFVITTVLGAILFLVIKQNLL